MSPQNCPNYLIDVDCQDCSAHHEGRCYGTIPTTPIIDILTDRERIVKLEAQSPKPQPTPKYDIQHLQAQINFLEKRLIKVEARKKRYAKY